MDSISIRLKLASEQAFPKPEAIITPLISLM